LTVRRHDGRNKAEPRAVVMAPGFHRNAEGSVLYRAGGTAVLCTASVSEEVPKWLGDRAEGWLTAEYQMHPRSSPLRREPREGRDRSPRGRTMEIQRLVGRALRSALDLGALGRRTITVDCDVLEADGGTRTASITGGFVAVAAALGKLGLRGTPERPVLRDQVAAVSVGLVGGEILVDLDYAEDSAADVDMNVVATVDGRLVEVQATAEGVAIERQRFEAMLDAALATIAVLGDTQRRGLGEAGLDLGELLGSASR
jgi:ribonuclease PH